MQFNHLWTVQNIVKYAFSSFYAVFNPVNQKFGFVSNLSDFTEEDDETPLQMDIDKRYINYVIEKSCDFVPSVNDPAIMERKNLLKYKGQKNFSSRYSSYIDSTFKEKHRIRQFNGVDVPNATPAPYINYDLYVKNLS